MVVICKGTELLFPQCEDTELLVRVKGCKITAYTPCMLTQVLSLVADSDKQMTCVGCILFY